MTVERVEIRVSRDKFRKLKSIKRKVESLLNDPAAIETSLAIIRLNYLTERRDSLRVKLREMEEHYRSLVEFQEKAIEDKELLKRFRRELSQENARLRRMLEERRYGSGDPSGERVGKGNPEDKG